MYLEENRKAGDEEEALGIVTHYCRNEVSILLARCVSVSETGVFMVFRSGGWGPRQRGGPRALMLPRGPPFGECDSTSRWICRGHLCRWWWDGKVMGRVASGMCQVLVYNGWWM